MTALKLELDQEWAPELPPLDAWTRTLALLAFAAQHPKRAHEVPAARLPQGTARELLAVIQGTPSLVTGEEQLVDLAEARGVWPLTLAALLDRVPDRILNDLAWLGERELRLLALPTRSSRGVGARAFIEARDAAARALLTPTAAATA